MDSIVYDNKNVKWLFPNENDRNISATINGIAMGKYSSKDNNNINIIKSSSLYHVKIPTISDITYNDIAENIIKINKYSSLSSQASLISIPLSYHSYYYRYLKFTKKDTITKSCLKKIVKLLNSTCPVCKHVNCFHCCQKNEKIKLNPYLLRYNTIIITCFNCNNKFKTRRINYNFNKMIFYKIIGFQNKKCMQAHKLLYEEFLHFFKSKKDQRMQSECCLADSSKIKLLYNSLTDESKKNLGYCMDTLYYSINVKITINNKNIKNEQEKKITFIPKSPKNENNVCDGEIMKTVTNEMVKKNNNDNIVIIKVPPMAFFLGTNKSASFFKKLIDPKYSNILNTKTKYGSVVSRGSGGKANMFRTICCNRRYTSSARLVIVPRSHLKPHECILPYVIYCRLGCPKYVLCHRYPTLDLKSMTFHEVKSTWQFPSMAISTAIVEGNNADFDGDCLHVIPAMTLVSQAELKYLLHPKHNIISQHKLRVTFDHDERQTIFSLFGLNSNEIHEALYAMALNEGSLKTYTFFCKIKDLCRYIWQTKTIGTVSCRDFLSLIRKNTSYMTYINEIYHQIPLHNGIKEIIESRASRFSIDHLWQLFGEISHDARMGFLAGMNKKAFIKVATNARENLISEISLYGYTIIKLTHCTKSIYVGYDNKVYTTDGILVALDINDLI